MSKEFTAESLKEAIQLLEIKQAESEKQLRIELLNVYENLKPINILKNIARDAASSETLKHDAANTMASLMSGFISKKIIVGKSKNPFLKLIGIGVQLGMTTLVSKNYKIIKDYVSNYINQFLENKESNENTTS
jgi:hypothetical protein